METQQLKLQHLAPYLPYKLKVLNSTHGIMIMDCWSEFSRIEKGKRCHIQGVLNGTNKPVLRPLSDLTKDVKANGVNLHFMKGLFSNKCRR